LLAFTTFVIGYKVVLVFFTLFQRSLIYVPTRLSMAAAEHEAASNGFVSWLNNSGQLIGWKLPARSKSRAVF
jgi:hypothetical protein